MKAKQYLVRKKLFLGTYKNRFGSGLSHAPWRTVKKYDTEKEAREFMALQKGLDRYEIKYGKTVIATKE